MRRRWPWSAPVCRRLRRRRRLPPPPAACSPAAAARAPPQVIHMRNLAFDITPEELREFCSPFGQVVAIKSQVRAGGMRQPARAV